MGVPFVKSDKNFGISKPESKIAGQKNLCLKRNVSGLKRQKGAGQTEILAEILLGPTSSNTK